MKLSRSIIGLGLGLACASISVFAETPPLNITIPLGRPVTLQPGDMDKLSLSALGVGESYKVICIINDANNSNYKAPINVTTSGSVKLGSISDNGTTIGYGFTENAPLQAVSNTLVVDNVIVSTSGASLIIKNAANSTKGYINSIDVSQCVAQGETTSKK